MVATKVSEVFVEIAVEPLEGGDEKEHMASWLERLVVECEFCYIVFDVFHYIIVDDCIE